MPKVLIVDDDPDTVEACRIVLEQAGFETEGASSRAEGMRSIEKARPDAIVLDVVMDEPDDGFTMAQELQRRGEGIPILMLTSVGQAAGLSFGKDEDVVPVAEFVDKPIAPKDLVAKIQKLVQR
jgi:DNA-binding response OmpR family regulator